MKKRRNLSSKTHYPALTCLCMLCMLSACGSDAEKLPENREAMIEEVQNLPDAEIKIPAVLIGDELADVPVFPADSAEPDGSSPAPSEGAAPASSAEDDIVGAENESADEDEGPTGQYGQLDEDNNVTYHLDGDTRTQLLNDLAENIRQSIDTVLDDKYYYPNITDIKVNSDCTEFTIYLSASTPNLYESSLVLSFYTVGDQYQIYNGVPMEEAKTTVIYVNSDTGAELARTDSSSAQ